MATTNDKRIDQLDTLVSPTGAELLLVEDPTTHVYYKSTATAVLEDFSDKNYIQTFTGATTVSVTHSLAKYPAVTIIDTAGDECEGSVHHIDINNLTVTFSSGNSGTVYCN